MRLIVTSGVTIILVFAGKRATDVSSAFDLLRTPAHSVLHANLGSAWLHFTFSNCSLAQKILILALTPFKRLTTDLHFFV